MSRVVKHYWADAPTLEAVRAAWPAGLARPLGADVVEVHFWPWLLHRAPRYVWHFEAHGGVEAVSQGQSDPATDWDPNWLCLALDPAVRQISDAYKRQTLFTVPEGSITAERLTYFLCAHPNADVYITDAGATGLALGRARLAPGRWTQRISLESQAYPIRLPPACATLAEADGDGAIPDGADVAAVRGPVETFLGDVAALARKRQEWQRGQQLYSDQKYAFWEGYGFDRPGFNESFTQGVAVAQQPLNRDFVNGFWHANSRLRQDQGGPALEWQPLGP